MDFAKLIEQRDKLIANVTARLESRGADADAALRPVELQQAQADRVQERIESLEQSKTEMLSRIDAELEQLNSELAARRDQIETEQEALTKDAAAAPAPAPKGDKGLEAAAERATPASTPDEKKKASPSSKAPKSS